MGLSSELISQFVKITNDSKDTVEETTVYGTIVEYEGSKYVRLDGSKLLTPISTAANVEPNERVSVMIKNHTATVTGNLSSPAARTAEVEETASKISGFEIVLADKVDTKDLVAEQARIDALIAKDVEIAGSLKAAEADIETLQADHVTVTGRLDAAEAYIEKLVADKIDVDMLDAKYAKIEELEATNADVHNLEATYVEFEVATANKFTAVDATIKSLDTDKLDANTANITYAKISDLDATNADISNLEADVADIDTLIFGSATGSTIQTSFANAVIAQLGDAQIKSAMIENISAGKIVAGDIITNNVRVRSEDGKLLISDETIQISDDTRVRVQIGKDAANDYSINIWDAAGNLMFSKGGITDSAIKNAIIRNDMVSDTANIAAHKLNIDSLFEEINGSTNTIKSTQIYLDDQAQTLNVAFKELETDVTELGETVSSQGTQISVVQGKIESKVWQQDINAATNEMSTQYSTLKQGLDGVTATVASHTAQINDKADSTTVANVSDRVSTLEIDLTGFKSTVSETYATTEQMNSAIKQSADGITSSVSKTYVTKTEFDDLDIGGRNLFSGHDENEIRLNDYQNVGSFTQFINHLTFDPVETVGETYTISFWAKSPNGSTPLYIYNQNGKPRYFYFPSTLITDALGSDWEYFTHTFTNTDMGASYTGADYNRLEIYAPSKMGVLIKKIKVENGNKATDWTPAPEDMATGNDIDAVHTSLDDTGERVSNAETLIQQLSDKILNLVKDADGNSLVVQDGDSWTFSTGQIQSSLDSISEDLSSLVEDMGGVNNAVDGLQQSVEDLELLNNYVKIGNYENEPCIELGKIDSDFRLLITNTRIMFMEGSNIPAYINNQSLHIKKAVIEEELQQGEFIWKARRNGNLGLMWKGVNG